MDSILKQVQSFDDSLSVEEALTPPASWYVWPEFHDLDSELLKTYWQFVGHVGFFKGPGSYFSGEFAGESYVVTQDQDGQLHAFYNVCRHHAAQLVEGRGSCQEIVCPYHAWSYGLNGDLKKAPHLAGIKNFNRSEMGLRNIPLKLWGPFILLNFTGETPDLPADWDHLLNQMKDTGFEHLKFIDRRAYELKCNWKVYIDNYLDGGYHIAHLHKGLAGQLDLDAYKVENHQTWTMQWCESAKEATTGEGGIDFKERIGEKALYAWIYPNMMINRYGDIMDTNWVVPLGPDRCLTIFDYYFDPKYGEDFIAPSIRASEKVQAEDVDICGSVQKGLSSKGYGVGRYAPRLESGAYLFHQLVKRDLMKILEIKKTI